MTATKQQIERVLAAPSEFEGLTIRDVFTEGAPMEDIVRMVLNAHESPMLAALRAIKIRMHFMGHPAEPCWNANAGRSEDARAWWMPDWRYEIALIENALHGSVIDKVQHPGDTKPRHELGDLVRF